MKLASIGIEDGYVLAQTILVENSSQAINWRLMGDGLRSVIPKVTQGEAWGSQALRQQKLDHPFWENRENNRFWQQYAHFVHQFLGYIPIQKAKGIEVVIATENPTNAPPGFTDAEVISPNQALLARRLMAESDYYQAVLLVVAVGDRSTHLSTHRVKQGQVQSSNVQSHPIGLLSWYEHLLAELQQRHGELSSSETCLDYLDAVLELGHHLQQDPSFSGTLSKNLLSVYQLKQSHWQNWTETQIFREWLNDTAQELLKNLGYPAPDQIVLGGIGTHWPVSSLLSGPIWNSPTQIIDIAFGASVWSECCKHYRGFGEPAFLLPSQPQSESGQTSAPTKTPIPPWQRHLK
nr:MAG: hypothetical protein EDM05_06360 [Leptolyngbya sp. IPPAS B-1204]